MDGLVPIFTDLTDPNCLGFVFMKGKTYKLPRSISDNRPSPAIQVYYEKHWLVSTDDVLRYGELVR